MEPTEDPQDRIDRYLLERMAPAERARFEALLDRDAGLRREVAAQQQVVGLLEKAGDARLRNQLDGVYAQVIGKERGRAGAGWTGLGRTAWAAAAAVVLVVSLLLWVWGRNEANPDALFVQYYRPEPYLVTRSPEARTGGGGGYFNQGEYRQALAAFEARLRQDPNADYDRLYAGLCYLELGAYDQAGERFARVAARSQLLGERATWYLALTHLKNNRVAESKTALRKLAAGPANGGHAEAARRLLADLE